MLSFVLKLVFVFIVLCHLGILILCRSARLDAARTCTAFAFIYQRSFTFLLRGIFHPLLFIKSIIGFLFYICFGLAVLLLHPTPIIGIYVPALPVFLAVKFMASMKLSIFFIIPLAVVVLWISCRAHNIYFRILNDRVLLIWKAFCFAKQYFKNVSADSYDKIIGRAPKARKAPKDYADEEEQSYKKGVEDARQRAADEEKREPQKTVHKKNALDILYQNELSIFGLYMKDFTEDDLKKKKRELLKIHHPDNYTDASEAEIHRIECDKINAAFTVLMKELKARQPKKEA